MHLYFKIMTKISSFYVEAFVWLEARHNFVTSNLDEDVKQQQ